MTREAPSVIHGLNPVTASYSPKIAAWENLVTACKSENVTPEIIMYPRSFKDHVTVMKRGRVVRKWHELGTSDREIIKLTGMSERRFYQILGNRKVL